MSENIKDPMQIQNDAPFRGSAKTTINGLIHDGIFSKNPVFVLALSLCPAVAVTSQISTAIGMGLAVMFVISLNNLIVSLLKNIINHQVRMPVYIAIIAVLVTLAQLFMSAYFPEVYKDLGVYLALIVVFAIILARAEVFASKNKPWPSFMDGFGMGFGFLIAMLVISVVRELFGTGKLLGYPVLGADYQPILLIVLAPGGFIVIGVLIGLFKTFGGSKK
jgi:electron transport complex protein RnfE